MTVAYTLPTAGDHPRIHLGNTTANGKGPLLTIIRDRVTTGSNKTHRKWWDGNNSDGTPASPQPTGQNLQSYCNQRLNTSTYPNTYFATKEGEYTGALAFSYLMDNANTAHADRAIQIALYLCTLTVGSSQSDRNKVAALAMVYDWAYARISTGDRSTIRKKIRDYVDALEHIGNTTEFYWGEAHGDDVYAVFALLAILEDMLAGEGTTNAQLVTWLNDLLDRFDNGVNNVSYFAGFRHFGNSDGGTHKGAGPHGYDTQSETFYIRLMPAFKSCIGVNWNTSEAWWQNLGHWRLWTWRNDRSFYRIGEGRVYSKYHNAIEAHMLQIADNQSNVYGEHCQWLADEIEEVNDPFGGIWGPYQVWNILFRNTSRARIRPTVARMGTYMRHFANVACTVIRDGWDEAGTSWLFHSDKYFPGGHSSRSGGQFQAAVNGYPIYVKHGLYDPNQTTTWKNPADLNPDLSLRKTGHRYTYMNRACTHNVVRIKHDSEPSSNMSDSFQETLSGTSRFGIRVASDTLSTSEVTNIGDQLWPKNTGATKFEPHSVDDLIGGSPEAKWLMTPTALAPVEELNKAVYGVMDLTKYYWATKLTLYRRHFLWIGAGQIPSWDRPIMLIFDDITLPSIGTTPGNKATLFQLQAKVQAVWDSGNKLLTVTNGTGRSFTKILFPTTVDRAEISGFTVDGNTFPETLIDDYSDSVESGAVVAYRNEINPTAAGTRIQYLTFHCLCASNIAVPPTITTIDTGGSADVGWLGGYVNGIECRIEKGGSPYNYFVGVEGPPSPPSPGIMKENVTLYNNQILTAGGGPTTSAWQDVTMAHEVQVHIKLTNTTGITTRASVVLEVCANTTNNIVAQYEKALNGTKINNDVKSTSIRLPAGVKYFRIKATHSVGGDTRLDCEFTKVTAM